MKSLSKFFSQECHAWLRGAEVLIECGRQDGYTTKLRVGQKYSLYRFKKR